MTPDQAKKFVNEVKGSPDPRIRDFNKKIYMRQLRFYMRGFRVRGTE
jgi:hypothetical protein